MGSFACSAVIIGVSLAGPADAPSLPARRSPMAQAKLGAF